MSKFWVGVRIMNYKNIEKLDTLLIMDNSYEEVSVIKDNVEISQFIKTLFDINDDFYMNSHQPSKDEKRMHLKKLYEFIVDNIGSEAKLAEDLSIEICNLDSQTIEHTDYYQDLKIRSAIHYYK